MLNQTPDIRLLERIQAGDEEALVELHTRYANLVFSIAYRVLNDQMAAEEVTQDTFMRLWRQSYRYDSTKGGFVTWLLTVTRRLSIDLLRQQRRRTPPAGMLFMDEDPSLWERALATDSAGSDLRRTLISVLDELPDDQRQLIELAYFQGMTHSDIAEALGLPLGTVKTRIRTGMQRLRNVWMDTRVNPKQDKSP